MSKELDFLKQQGLKQFEITYRRGGKCATIWMLREDGFSSNGNRFHLKIHSRRLLCVNCQLLSNQGPINCNGIDVGRSGVSWVSEIKSNINLTPTYWKSLAKRIPCQPNADNDWNDNS